MGQDQPGPTVVERPLAVLAMMPGVDRQVLTEDAGASSTSWSNWSTSRRRPGGALPTSCSPSIEIVVGSWGCSVLDDALLTRMPKLRCSPTQPAR